MEEIVQGDRQQGQDGRAWAKPGVERQKAFVDGQHEKGEPSIEVKKPATVSVRGPEPERAVKNMTAA